MHVCFVCTGNICRSPMAAIVCSRALADAGMDEVRVSSCGIGPWHAGQPIDERAGAVLSDAGYGTTHRASHVDDDHLGADLLLAMDRSHYRELQRLVDDPAKVRLFGEFDPHSEHGDSGSDSLDVADPYYGGQRGFIDLLARIERTMPAIVEQLAR